MSRFGTYSKAGLTVFSSYLTITLKLHELVYFYEKYSHIYLFTFIFYFMSRSRAKVILQRVVLWLVEPVYTIWSRFCIANHWALANNYQLSNMECPG